MRTAATAKATPPRDFPTTNVQPSQEQNSTRRELEKLEKEFAADEIELKTNEDACEKAKVSCEEAEASQDGCKDRIEDQLKNSREESAMLEKEIAA